LTKVGVDLLFTAGEGESGKGDTGASKKEQEEGGETSILLLSFYSRLSERKRECDPSSIALTVGELNSPKGGGEALRTRDKNKNGY